MQAFDLLQDNWPFECHTECAEEKHPSSSPVAPSNAAPRQVAATVRSQAHDLPEWRPTSQPDTANALDATVNMDAYLNSTSKLSMPFTSKQHPVLLALMT